MRFTPAVLAMTITGCVMSPHMDLTRRVGPDDEYAFPDGAGVTALSLGETGDRLVVGSTTNASALLDRRLKVLTSWDVARSSLILGGVSERLGIVVLGDGDYDVHVLRTSDYAVVSKQRLGYRPSAVAFHPIEPVALVGTSFLRDKEGLVRRYDIEKGRWEVILDTKDVPGVVVADPGVVALRLSPDGKQLAVLTRSTGLVFDWETLQIVHVIPAQGDQLYQNMQYSHDGRRLILGDFGNTLWVHDTKTWECETVTVPDGKGIHRFCLTRDDKYLCTCIPTLSAIQPGCWAVYRFPDMAPLAYIPVTGRHMLGHIVAHPTEDKVYTGGGDGKVMVWSLAEVLKAKK